MGVTVAILQRKTEAQKYTTCPAHAFKDVCVPLSIWLTTGGSYGTPLFSISLAHVMPVAKQVFNWKEMSEGSSFKVNMMVRHDWCLPTWSAPLNSSGDHCIMCDFYWIPSGSSYLLIGKLSHVYHTLTTFICAPSSDLLNYNSEKEWPQVGVKVRILLPQS